MTRILLNSTLFAFLIFATVGCGGGADVAEQASHNTNVATASTKSPAETSATDVVSQFLDQVRRGGENSAAGELLTQRAQSELKRIGRTVQPIGSPDARFNVTQAREVPNEPNSMLVQSIWTEPGPEGTQNESEVVWAVQREAAGWRISGLAMETDPSEPPIVVDFENGDEMAKMLAGTEDSETVSENASQAAKPGSEELSR